MSQKLKKLKWSFQTRRSVCRQCIKRNQRIVSWRNSQINFKLHFNRGTHYLRIYYTYTLTWSLDLYSKFRVSKLPRRDVYALRWMHLLYCTHTFDLARVYDKRRSTPSEWILLLLRYTTRISHVGNITLYLLYHSRPHYFHGICETTATMILYKYLVRLLR